MGYAVEGGPDDVFPATDPKVFGHSEPRIMPAPGACGKPAWPKRAIPAP